MVCFVAETLKISPYIIIPLVYYLHFHFVKNRISS